MDDALFEQIFGRPRPRDQSIPVPFWINDQRRGQAIVVISGGRASLVQAAPVLDQTRDLLQPDLQAQLEASVDEAGFLSLGLLQQVGLTAIFDQSQLALYLTVPAALRRTNVVDALGVPPEAANALPISTISGYVNVLGGNDILWAGQEPTGRQPLRLSLDGALNVAGWVLEGQADVLEGGSPGVQRRDVRLVRDDPANALRYIAGDVIIPVSGAFQSLVPLGGISVSRNFSLQPYRITRPTGEFTFFLERPSQVEIYINGVRVQQLQLQAGPQDIRNLVLTTGSNDIQLIITDDLGQVQRLDFTTALAGNLLAPGLQQFSYNLGFPSGTVQGQRQYDWNQPQLALAHRWGATRTLTLGGYLQATPSFQMVEADGIWASALGNWGWDVALSHRGEVGVGMAARVQYERPTKAQDLAQRSLRVTAEYRDDRFTTLTSLTPSQDWLQLSAAYSQRLFDSARLNLGGSYSFGRTVPNTYSLNLGLSQTLSSGLSGSLNANYSRTTQSQEEVRVFLGLSWLLPARRQSLALNTNLSNTSRAGNQLQWRRSPDQPLMATGWSLNLNQNGDQHGVLGEMSYTDYRFDFKLSQAWDGSFNASDATATTHATRLTFGTALVFADGRFGWSRPVTNSFVLVVPRDRWRGQQIGVNPSSSGYGAVVNAFGPAVIPDLQPYYVSRLRLEALEAPLGYDLGPSEWVVWPSYRSGTLILAGTDATVFVRGVLVDGNGEPLGLQGGEVVSLSDATWPAQGFFTNRVGRFALVGLGPGRYEIRLRDSAPIEFEILPDQSGLVDLGSLVVRSAP
ncbi:MAG: fimbria/pilus outer membrane usher protein [Spirulina sp.]